MKKLLFISIAIFLSLSGCKNEDKTSSQNKTDSRQKVENWANYDDALDIKSEAKVDTALFRQEMNAILPAEKIVELFGSGYHNFYLALTISKEGEDEFALGPDISYWFPGPGRALELSFREGIELDNSKNNSLSTSHTNEKFVTRRAIFHASFPDIKKIFNVKPGLLNGKPVRSVKFFEVRTFIGPDKKILKPWSIMETDIKKYREHLLEKNVDKYYYSTGLPAIVQDAFESIRKAIVYPQEAQKNNVTGRVVVQLFADVQGNFAGYQLLKGLGYGCDEAVIKAIMDLKPKTYPTGQRSSIIVPFEFGPPQATPIDLAVQLFDVNPDPNVYNNIRLGIINKNKTDKNLDQRYFVYVYIDKHLVFQTLCNGISKSDAQQFYWFRFQPNKPGTYDYTVYIDPENRLNDSNRENNTVHGTLAVK